MKAKSNPNRLAHWPSLAPEFNPLELLQNTGVIFVMPWCPCLVKISTLHYLGSCVGNPHLVWFFTKMIRMVLQSSDSSFSEKDQVFENWVLKQPSVCVLAMFWNSLFLLTGGCLIIWYWRTWTCLCIFGESFCKDQGRKMHVRFKQMNNGNNGWFPGLKL